MSSKRRNGSPSTSDFASLPPDLLKLITTHLTDIRDYIRFRSVCPPWRLAAPHADFTHPHQLPFLLLSSTGPRPTTFALSFSNTKFYKLHLPEAHGNYLYGSPHGWLLMLDSNNGRRVSLLNPITRAQITLPRLPHCLQPDYLYSSYKVILCRNPTTATVQELLVAIWVSDSLFFIRQGDGRWCEVMNVGYRFEGDMAYYHGELFFVHCDGKLSVLDADSKMVKLVAMVSDFEDDFVTDFEENPRYNRRLHLVGGGGDLWLIDWVREKHVSLFGPSPYPAYTVEGSCVYKLERGEKGVEWRRVTDGIGNQTLFANIMECISLSDLPMDGDGGGCRANHIYFYTGQCSEKFEVLDLNGDDADVEVSTPWLWPDEVNAMPGFTWMVPSLH